MDEEMDSSTHQDYSEVLSLRNLERHLKQKIPQITENDYDKNGYIVEEHQIVALQLQNMKIDQFLDVFSNFKSLKTLHLENNEIKTVKFEKLLGSPELSFIDLGDNKIQIVNLLPVQKLKKLSTLIFRNNIIETIDLNPLKECKDLELLNLKNNKIKEVSLDFLDPSSPLWSLNLYGNPMKSLNITPLLALRSFHLLGVENDVTITASSIKRDYSLKQDWFVSEYLPRVHWQLSEEELQYQSLYEQYEHIVRNFRHDEFWADFRDRRLSLPPEASSDVQFFEFMVNCYLKIEDRPRSSDRVAVKQEHRQKLKEQVQDRFLTPKDLLPVLKKYFEHLQEPDLTVEDYEDELVILHYWRGGSPPLSRVQTITWVKIRVDELESAYQVTAGFNRGFLHQGKKYHSLSPTAAEEFPPDVFVSTEVPYEVSSFSSSNLVQILDHAREWLRQSYYPKFGPYEPDEAFTSGTLKVNF